MALTAQLCAQGVPAAPVHRRVHSLNAPLHGLFGARGHCSAWAACICCEHLEDTPLWLCMCAFMCCLFLSAF